MKLFPGCLVLLMIGLSGLGWELVVFVGMVFGRWSFVVGGKFVWVIVDFPGVVLVVD